MMPSYVALTTLTDRLRMDELAVVAAALQTQVMRDFAPRWGVSAVVAAMPFEAIPAGYCPVIVQDTLQTEGACGFHRTEWEEAPYILLPHGPGWSLAASHAVLQMLADPSGAGRRPGPSRLPGQGIVEYVVDVCAPCQGIGSAYTIDGIVVSDFCTPGFFGRVAAPDEARSFTGAVREALRPAADGFLTWLADDRLLYEARADECGRLSIHGGFSATSRGRLSLRELVYLLTPDRLERLSNARPTAALVAAQQNTSRGRVAGQIRFREEIAWRFGDPIRPRQPAPASSVAAAPEGYPAGATRSGHHFASGEVDTTARTDS